MEAIIRQILFVLAFIAISFRNLLVYNDKFTILFLMKFALKGCVINKQDVLKIIQH